MNLAVIGSGYVGLVSGTCFAEMGNKVICVDIDKDKIKQLKKGIIPMYEPGLSPMVIKNIKNENLQFSTSLKESIQDATVIFIAVGTPMGDDGSADLQHVISVAKEIGQHITREVVIVDKSTVPVGTADKVKETIQLEIDNRGLKLAFHMVSNPEFLKEGDAINDFMKPDRVVIGSDSAYSLNLMKQLYSPFFRTNDRFITMDIRSAEMTKYAANAMLATDIVRDETAVRKTMTSAGVTKIPQNVFDGLVSMQNQLGDVTYAYIGGEKIDLTAFYKVGDWDGAASLIAADERDRPRRQREAAMIVGNDYGPEVDETVLIDRGLADTTELIAKGKLNVQTGDPATNQQLLAASTNYFGQTGKILPVQDFALGSLASDNELETLVKQSVGPWPY